MSRKRQPAEITTEPAPPVPPPPPAGYTPRPVDLDVMCRLVQAVRPLPGLRDKAVALRTRMWALPGPYPPTTFDLAVLGAIIEAVRHIPALKAAVVALRDRLEAAMPPPPTGGPHP